MTKIEWDFEAQKKLEVPLGKREFVPNMGTYLADVLKEHGITVAFGVSGGHIWGITDPISRIGIKSIIPSHEQNAVYMAEAYSQVTQRPSVVFVTVGPGGGNAVSAVQQAFLSNTPILVLCGGHEAEHDKLFNTIQESYATELMSGITKWAQRVLLPHTVKQFTTRAFKVMQSAPKGPVLLELNWAGTVTNAKEFSKVWSGGVYGDHVSYIPNWRGEDTAKPIVAGGNPDDIAKAVERLYAVDRPFMILGDGPTWSQAGPEFKELINLAKIPFTTRRLGRGLIAETHPYCTRGIPNFMSDIELMIPVGVKVGFFDGFGGGWPETVQIAEAEQHIWTYIPTSVAILGNPKVVARQMIDYIKGKNLQPPASRDAWIKRIQEDYQERHKKRHAKALHYKDHPRYKKNNMIHWGYLAKLVADYMAEKYDNRNRVIIDGYTMSDFIMPFLTAVRPAQILTASEQAGVGHSFGMSIGAAIADIESSGDRTPVVALPGDAGVGLAGTEIEMAVRLRLPIVYIVTNNDGWLTGMKDHFYGKNWDVMGEQDHINSDWLGVSLPGPERTPLNRWDKMAEAFGAYGEMVDCHDDIPAALERCFKAAEKGQPALLNCIMDKTITNRAIFSVAYSLSFGHIPYEELPERGKASRWHNSAYIPAFSEIQKTSPELKLKDSWEPEADDE